MSLIYINPYLFVSGIIPPVSSIRVWASSDLPAAGPEWGTRTTGNSALYFHMLGGYDGPHAGITVTDDGTIFAAGMSNWRQVPAASQQSRIFVTSTDGGVTLSPVKDFYTYNPGAADGYDQWFYNSAVAVTSYINTIYVVHNTMNDDSTKNYTIVSKTSDYGNTWTHVTSPLADSLVTAGAICTSQGLYHIGAQADPTATYPGDSNSTKPLQIAYSSNEGTSWSITTIVDPNSFNYFWYFGYPLRFHVQYGAYTNGHVGVLTSLYNYDLGYQQLLYIRPTSATTWAAPVVVATEGDTGPGGVYGLDDQQSIRLLILKNNPGTILAFFWDNFNDRAMLSKSTDSGATWSTPVDVGGFQNRYTNDASYYTHKFDAVELDNGNICLIGLAVHIDGVGTASTSVTFYTVSTDAGSTFSYEDYAYTIDQLLNPLDTGREGNRFWFGGYGVEARAVGNNVVLLGSNWNTYDIRSFTFTPSNLLAASTTTSWINQIWSGYSVNISNPPYGSGRVYYHSGNAVINNDTYVSAQHLLTKLDQYGNVAWSKAIGITADVPVNGGFAGGYNYTVVGYNGQVCKSGSDLIFVATNLDDNGSASSKYLSLSKISSAGSITWHKHYNIGLTSTVNSGVPPYLFADSTGNIYIPNITNVNTVEILKFNSSGEFVWRREINVNYIYGMVIDYSDNIILVVESYSPNLSFSGIIKMNSSGGVTWAYKTTSTGFYDVDVDSSDNLYCTVGSYTTLVKINSSGSVIWTNDYSAGYSYYVSVFNDDVYLTGSATFGTGGDAGNYIGSQSDPYYVAKISSVDGSVVFANEHRSRAILNNNYYIQDRVRFKANNTIVLYAYNYGPDNQYIFSVPADGTKTGLYYNDEYRYTPITGISATTATPVSLTSFSPTITTPASPVEQTWSLYFDSDTTSVIKTQTIEIP